MTIEKNSCSVIAGFLPDALLMALASYEKFSASQDIPQDPKGFSAHHSACKVAIAHIELLIKLAERVMAEGPEKAGDENMKRLEEMMVRAKEEMSRSPFMKDMYDDEGDQENTELSRDSSLYTDDQSDE